MAIATYKDLCIDAVDAAAMGRFWAAALRLDLQVDDDGDARLTGPTPRHTVWLNTVPEPVTVKQRMHLDVRADSIDDLVALGGVVVDAESFEHWTVMKDVEGGELCVFATRAGKPAGLMEIVVDTADASRICAWWAGVLGAEAHDHEDGYSYVEPVPGAPFESLVFVPVPEPKTVKNRIHIDVTTPDVQLLLDAGATLLRARDDEIRWNVLADPDGNEFCAFAQTD
ncbi:MAG TPA: VOC family protein [Frankiaceae bacterium]|nr:VOC family protein [Frankiaceae bacterium]